MKKDLAFRFAYFTKKYQETCGFYRDKVGLKLEHSWDRSEHDKGALFKAGAGLIEVLHLADDEEHRHEGVDHRQPQGAYMCIEVANVDELFNKLKAANVPFEQEITDQPWGHRSFSAIEPNGLILFFFEEQF